MTTWAIDGGKVAVKWMKKWNVLLQYYAGALVVRLCA